MITSFVEICLVSLYNTLESEVIILDPNWIMAIIAISAIFTPAIVAVIDNIYKYKTKELELFFPNQQKALSNFVEKAMLFYIKQNFNYTIEYTEAKSNLFVYFNIDSDSLFKQLEQYEKEKDIINYKETIHMIVKRLSQQLKK